MKLKLVLLASISLMVGCAGTPPVQEKIVYVPVCYKASAAEIDLLYEETKRKRLIEAVEKMNAQTKKEHQDELLQRAADIYNQGEVK